MRSLHFACVCCVYGRSSPFGHWQSQVARVDDSSWSSVEEHRRVQHSDVLETWQLLTIVLMAMKPPPLVGLGSASLEHSSAGIDSGRAASYRQKRFYRPVAGYLGIKRKRVIVNALVAAGTMFVLSEKSQAISYCIPGVTAERCQGYFWETGQLYKKDRSNTQSLTSAEYDSARNRLHELQVQINSLQALVDEGFYPEAGAKAAEKRSELRQVGERVCDSLEGEQRVDSQDRLFKALASLDDFDVIILQQQDTSSPPSFSEASFALGDVTRYLSLFLENLPSQPTVALD